MIIFVTTSAHAYTLENLLRGESTPLSGQLILLTYAEFASWKRLPAGAYVLADVDRLDESERDGVGSRLAALQLALPGCRVLNHPRRSLRRPELLTALQASGRNDFKACPADGDHSSLRYPVFVRSAIEHDGTLTPLLHSPDELQRAIEQLRRQQGGVDGDWLVVEYIDVRNDGGWFEKYSAYRIGDHIIAADRSVNGDWVCKGESDETSPEGWEHEDRAFQMANPHAVQLKAIFELAQIEYGRIDYAFHAGRLQVFEINTNPMIASPRLSPPEWQPATQRKTQQFCDALLSLDAGSSGPYFVQVPAGTGKDHVAGTGLKRGLRRLLRRLHLLHREQDLLRGLDRLKPRRAGH